MIMQTTQRVSHTKVRKVGGVLGRRVSAGKERGRDRVRGVERIKVHYIHTSNSQRISKMSKKEVILPGYMSRHTQATNNSQVCQKVMAVFTERQL